MCNKNTAGWLKPMTIPAYVVYFRWQSFLNQTTLYMAALPVKFLFLLTCLAGGETLATGMPADIFEAKPVSVPVKPGKLDEASGIADSKTHPGYLWVEQDSGNPSQIYLLSHTGEFYKKIKIKGASNRDWEDMVLANGPDKGKNYIYLGDIGSNNMSATRYFIYRFPEPALNADTVFTYDKLVFQYPDGSHDAEAMLVDNTTRDIYIITKRDKPAGIYKIPYPQSATEINKAVSVGLLPFSGVVSAALSPDGKEVLVKTYTTIYYWKRKPGQTLEQTLQSVSTQLSYQLEPQGEAICFKQDNSGFFTLSEKPSFMNKVTLDFYKRKK
jgi:hypothetical protein